MSKNLAGWLFVLVAVALFASAWGAEGAFEPWEWCEDDDVRLHWFLATFCGMLSGFAGISMVGGRSWSMVAAFAVMLSVGVLQVDGPQGAMERTWRLSWRLVWITLGVPTMAVMLDWMERIAIRRALEVKG